MTPKILFVDDQKNVLQGLRRSLFGVRKEWDMHFAEGGKPGLEILQAGDFDVVISDMRMPEMDGAQFLEEVSKKHPETARFVLSGQADKETTYRAIGPSHQFFSKPFDADELMKTVARVLSLRARLDRDSVRVISGLRCLPSPVGNRQSLRQVMEEGGDKIEPVAAVIADDVGMSLKTLQLTNSTYFGIGAEVYCPVKAAQMLDNQVLSDLVSLKRFSVPLANGVNEDEFRHISEIGLKTAQISLNEAKQKDLAQATQKLAGAVGLFSVLKNLLPMTEEGNHMGTVDDDAVAYMLALWGMPAALIDMFDKEVSKEDEAQEINDIVRIAKEQVTAQNAEGVVDEQRLDAVGYGV